MGAQLIDGNGIRAKILQEINQNLVRLKRKKRGVPGLAVIRVGSDPASGAYIRQKELAAQALGFGYQEFLFAANARQSDLIELIGQLNQDAAVHGILLQLPLPAHLNADQLAMAINPSKDVDGLHPVNAGRLYQGQVGLRPCTPSGVMRILEEIGFEPAGKNAVIVGRSNIVGKPMAMLLLAANATATICHRQSDVPFALGQADLVVAAVGVPRSIKGEWIKPGAVVIDVGINRMDGKLVGDVEFEEACERASFITPVPGGVGAITVAMLMHNTFLAWKGEQRRRPEAESGCLPATSPWPAAPGQPLLATGGVR